MTWPPAVKNGGAKVAIGPAYFYDNHDAVHSSASDFLGLYFAHRVTSLGNAAWVGGTEGERKVFTAEAYFKGLTNTKEGRLELAKQWMAHHKFELKPGFALTKASWLCTLFGGGEYLPRAALESFEKKPSKRPSSEGWKRGVAHAIRQKLQSSGKLENSRKRRKNGAAVGEAAEQQGAGGEGEQRPAAGAAPALAANTTAPDTWVCFDCCGARLHSSFVVVLTCLFCARTRAPARTQSRRWTLTSRPADAELAMTFIELRSEDVCVAPNPGLPASQQSLNRERRRASMVREIEALFVAPDARAAAAAVAEIHEEEFSASMSEDAFSGQAP